MVKKKVGFFRIISTVLFAMFFFAVMAVDLNGEIFFLSESVSFVLFIILFAFGISLNTFLMFIDSGNRLLYLFAVFVYVWFMFTVF